MVRPAYAAAFYALVYLLAMAHEAGHLVVGDLGCSSYVGMTFNLVRWPPGCSRSTAFAYLSSAAGPAVSYCFAWAGAFLLRSRPSSGLGFALVFGNLPFARVFTAAIGGGDERGLGVALLGPAGRWLALAVVLTLASVPVWIAVRRIPWLRRPLVLAGWLILPMLADFAVRLTSLERLLSVMPEPVWLGVPALVWLVGISVAVAFVVFGGVRTLSQLPGPADVGRTARPS